MPQAHRNTRHRCAATTSTSCPAHRLSGASPAARRSERGSEPVGYIDPQGLPVARAAVADYLRRPRGVQADAQHIVLCSGATQAVALLGRALQGGELPLAMEDP